MHDIIKEMSENLEELERLIAELTAKSQKQQSGILRCSNGNRGAYCNYFIREEGEPRQKEHYVPHGDLGRAKQLAERDYNAALLKFLRHEYAITKEYVSACGVAKCERLFTDMAQGRQELVSPLFVPRKTATEKWRATPYVGKEISCEEHPLRTNRGELVRSKSEKIIADRLEQLGIPYHYEYPIKLKGYPKEIYVDFLVLNQRTQKEYYWEHLGMMDDAEYYAGTMWRLDLYEKNDCLIGEKLILTHETSRIPIRMETVDSYINRYLK